jgi:hypothetical protein
MKRFLGACMILLSLAVVSQAANVYVPDNGSGTAVMPIQSDYPGLTQMQISNGLPPATTVDITATLETPLTPAEAPGGALGGTSASGTGPLFTWQMQGTGTLSGYSRTLVMPGNVFTVHAAPRMAFAPTQAFNTQIAQLQGQIVGGGDPDFDLLRVTAGNDFGLPSPGQTTLTQVGPNWNVESYYDMTYRIDFVGRPGGPFGGMSGSTTGVARFQIGMPIPEPSGIAAASSAILAGLAYVWRRRRKPTTACDE